jgi:hypothetical protein
MKTQETMILDLRLGRDQLEKFEYVLKWYQLNGDKAYTPDSYLAEVIEKEYARVA